MQLGKVQERAIGPTIINLLEVKLSRSPRSPHTVAVTYEEETFGKGQSKISSITRRERKETILGE